MINKQEVRETVKDGAAWLDENHPGWETRLDLSELAMNNCDRCVIGQAVGDYYDVTMEASIGDDLYDSTLWAIEHGFQAPDEMYYDEEEDEWFDDDQKIARYYAILEDLWTEEVKDRFNRGLS